MTWPYDQPHYRYGTKLEKPTKTVTRTITFGCLFPDGECKYKNPVNLYGCVGCNYYAMVLGQSDPVIKRLGEPVKQP